MPARKDLSMPKLRYISRPLVKMVYKMKHHRGHGIHSPFLFALITKVIEEKTPYYAYTDIDNFLRTYPILNRRSTKQDRLFFRLVNYFSCRSILEIGSKSGVSVLHLTAPSVDIVYQSVGSTIHPSITNYIQKEWERNTAFYSEFIEIGTPQDCIVIDMRGLEKSVNEVYQYASNLIDEKTFIILKNLRTNKHSRSLWNQFRADERVSVSLDLYNLGILFFNPKLFRRNYIISF